MRCGLIDYRNETKMNFVVVKGSEQNILTATAKIVLTETAKRSMQVVSVKRF